MQIQFPWGSDSLKVEVPDSWKLIFPEKRKRTGSTLKPEVTIVEDALANPVQSAGLTKTSVANKNILIIVDDNTRPTPVDRFFHLVLDELKDAGADFEHITLMPALGIHSPMSDDEMAAKVGAGNLQQIKWKNHNAFDEDQLQDFGSTARGTPVRLNREVAVADYIIIIGLIEPHVWAGFGGGLKNIFPGVAASDCIGAHHAIIAEPPYLFNRVGMEPPANPFRLDFEDVRQMISAQIFCLNVILDHTNRIIGAFAGDPVAAHREGVHFNKEISGRYIDVPVDGIVVNSHPMDINFKQSMKGVGNSLPALKPGGTVMGFLRAERGIDDITLPDDAKPLWLVKKILRLLGPSRVMWFLEKVRPGQIVEEKFLMYYAMQLIRQYELYFHVPTITAEEEKRLGFFINFSDPQQVIKAAHKKLAKNATVAVFEEAGATFPVLQSA